jgi:hypothetical protein
MDGAMDDGSHGSPSIQKVTPNYPIPHMEGKCKPHFSFI